MPFDEEILRYLALYAIGTAAGIFRSGRDHEHSSFIGYLCAGGTSGFLSISVVTLLLPRDMQLSPTGVGVSTVCGLVGQQLAKRLLEALVKRIIGVNVENTDGLEKDSS